MCGFCGQNRVAEDRGDRFRCVCQIQYMKAGHFEPRVLRVTIEGPMDSFEHQPFILEWVEDDGRIRGQVFRGNVSDALASWGARGWRVLEREAWKGATTFRERSTAP